VVEKYVWKRTIVYILASIIIDFKIGLWTYVYYKIILKIWSRH